MDLSYGRICTGRYSFNSAINQEKKGDRSKVLTKIILSK